MAARKAAKAAETQKKADKAGDETPAASDPEVMPRRTPPGTSP
jgi:hypothetical protein